MAFFNKPRQAKYKLNWKPSPHDARDFKYADLLAKQKPFKLPASADVGGIIPEVFDQGQVGSCTGNAGAMVGLHRSRMQQREITPSRLMLYYDARLLEGSQNSDDGAYIRDIFKAWEKSGVCAESTWKYDESKVTIKPMDSCYTEGKKTLAVAYHSLNNTVLDELKACIASGSPFELGFNVYQAFMYGNWADTMPMPKNFEKLLGGHAVTAIGYDDSRKAFRIKNSWGADWKDGGHFWMPYDFIISGDCGDFWMLEALTPGEVVPTPDKVTSIIDLNDVFYTASDLKCLSETNLIRMGKAMGLNTDKSKSKAVNRAIVAGGLGVK